MTWTEYQKDAREMGALHFEMATLFFNIANSPEDSDYDDMVNRVAEIREEIETKAERNYRKAINNLEGGL
jgi:hypothetical protein